MNKALTAKQYLHSRYVFICTALMFGGVVSGCASLAPTSAATSVAARNQYQETFSINGRIQVQYQQNEKEQSLPGNFEWTQTAADTSITLLSQLGQTIAIINQNASGASLQQANQPIRLAVDVNTLVSETLGWPLPLLGMRDWLQGYARNSEGIRAAIPANDSQLLSADGWQLRYVSWQEDAGRRYPKRIDLHRYTTQAGEVTLRIVIDQWKTP